MRRATTSTASLLRHPPLPPIRPKGASVPFAPTLRAVLFALSLLMLVMALRHVIEPARERNRTVEGRVERLIEENRELREHNLRLATEIRALTDDPIYIEHVLRRELRYLEPVEAARRRRIRAAATEAGRRQQ